MNATKLIQMLIFTSLLMYFSSCALLPVLKQTHIAKNPPGNYYTTVANYNLKDGYPRHKAWWVVYSDRSNNITNIGPKNEIPQKKLPFLEPMYITKTKGDYVKVVQYMPDLDLDSKHGRVNKKTVKSFGWIKKDNLLLWSGSLKDENSGFFAKAITCINGKNIIQQTNRYINDNDSLILYSNPDLTSKSGKTLPLGTLVYLYKQSDDKKSFLIGTEEKATPENVKQTLLGWISAEALSIWGTRGSFTFSDSLINNKTPQENIGLYATEEQALQRDSLPLLHPEDMETRTIFEKIFPIQNSDLRNDSVIKTHYLENILDYSKNKVLNVLGNPIYYPQYKKIIRDGQRVNIVFVMDASTNNRIYFPSVKAVLQDLQFYFDTTKLFKNHHFGAVVYKQNKCYTDNISYSYPLTNNYDDIVRFIDQKQKELNCEDMTIYQPVYKGITEACNLLDKVKDETNIIVLIGTTGNDGISNYNLGDAIENITKVNARLMLFQSISKPNNAYNDFVLSAEKTVIHSAQNLGELKKEKMVEMADIIDKAKYNLVEGDSGVYFLDYPAKSMVQGFVLFPKKGEAMQPTLFKKSFETLLQQVVFDNNKINTALQNYFRRIGIKTTFIKAGFTHHFDSVYQPLPDYFSKVFINEQNGFFIPAFAPAKPLSALPQSPSYGVLLSEDEYDKIVQQFYTIYQRTATSELFHRRRAYRRYRRFLKRFIKENKISTNTPINEMTAASTLYLFTGYISTDSLWNNITINNLKKDTRLEQKTLLHFYYSFKRAADTLLEDKNTLKTRLYFNDKTYYWVDKPLMP